MLKLTTLVIFSLFSSTAWAVATCGVGPTNVQGEWGEFIGVLNARGCLTAPVGLTPDTNGTPSHFSDASIAWHIEYVSPGVLRYNYEFEDKGSGDTVKKLSHMILGLSDPGCGSTIGTTGPAGTNGCIWGITGAEIKTHTEQQGNPGMVDSLYGIKLSPGTFTSGPNSEKVSFSFLSNHAPVWQDFYAKDGGYPGGDAVFVRNAGWGDRDGFNYYIAAPDTTGAQVELFNDPVPEPGFYGLVSIGLAGLYAVARRRRAQA